MGYLLDDDESLLDRAERARRSLPGGMPGDRDALPGTRARRAGMFGDAGAYTGPGEDELEWLLREEEREDTTGPEEPLSPSERRASGLGPAPGTKRSASSKDGGTLGDVMERSRERDVEADALEALATEGAPPVPEDERAALFRDTPTGPGITYHPDGSATRTAATGETSELPPGTASRVVGEPGEAPSGGRVVEIDWGDEYEEPLNVVASGVDDAPLNAPGMVDTSTVPFDAGDEADPLEAEPDADGDDALYDMDARDWADSADQGFEAVPQDATPESMAIMRAAAEGPITRDSEVWSFADDSATTLPGTSHAEPDADELGGAPDGDADDSLDRALGLADPRGSRFSSASTPEGAASSTKGAGSPATSSAAPDPAAGALRAQRLAALQQMIDGLAQMGAGWAGARGFTPSGSVSDEINAAGEAEDAATTRDMSARRAAKSADEALASRERIAATRATRTPTELELAREARLARDAERRAGFTERGLDLRERDVATRVGRAERTAELDEARRLPESDESARAREAFSMMVSGLPATVREALGATDERLAELSAEEIEDLEARIPSYVRHALGRGRGAAGAGGGGAGRSAMLDQLVSAGVASTPEEAEGLLSALGTSGARTLLRDAIDEGTGREAGRDEGLDLVPGVPMSDITTYSDPTTIRAVRDRLGAYREGSRALGEIETLLEGRGAESVVNPALLAEIEPSLVALRSMVAQIQGTGVINPGERPLIDATLPDASSIAGWTLGRVAATFRGWRRRLEGATSSALEGLGVSDESIEGGLDYVRSGGGAARARRHRAAGEGGTEAPAGDGETVRVRAPDGRTGSIPRARLEAAIAAGYAEVEE